ncbi:MAG: prepilin-type N-terminal cleavage/methylation domain-containing protein, partial [Planctomycetes bacterium]|nr:prepilin-type N-terminal cleavage/methylation domain-containing protein [Planctomycetota bacterium]
MIKATTKERGFTLIEMMVALAMGAIVMAPLYIVTRGMSDRTETQRMDVEATQRSRFGLDALIRDFRRAGMYTSPNTEIEPKYRNRDITGSTAQFRRAVIHLNRGQGGNDAVLLTGAFLGGRAYPAIVQATNQFT